MNHLSILCPFSKIKAVINNTYRKSSEYLCRWSLHCRDLCSNLPGYLVFLRVFRVIRKNTWLFYDKTYYILSKFLWNIEIWLFAEPTPSDVQDIPIILNNRNRYSSLVNLIRWLENIGFKRIIILDNDSCYEPLLNYYKESKHEVVYLGQNIGYQALWKCPVYKRIRNNYYVYSDPDLAPIAECPQDFLDHFMEILTRYPKYDKVGFGLKIDDLPDCYSQKEKVVALEKQFWTKEIETGVFEAPIDTTFALYRPFHWGGDYLHALRTGYPYLLRHLPWYINSSNLSEEEEFYIRHVQGTFWSKLNK